MNTDMSQQYGPFAAAAVVGVIGLFLGEWALLAWLAAAAIACGGVVWLTPRWGVLATSVLGLGCSAYLFTLKLNAETGPALCDINDRFSCGVVNDSAASELFGVPIALLGSGFFLGMAISAAIARETSSRLYATSAVLGGIGALYSVYLAYEAYNIGAVCVMCLAIYACTGLLVWAGLRGMSANGESLGDIANQIPTSLTFATTTASLLLVVLGGVAVMPEEDDTFRELTGEAPTEPAAPAPQATPAPTAPTPEQAEPDERNTTSPKILERLAQFYAPARIQLQASDTDPVLGDLDAPYTVLEYADFACPHCAQAAVEVKKLVAQVPAIQVRFRPFPRSGLCNRAVEGDAHPERCRAALGAECARRQGKFWEYSGRVFENYGNLSDDALVQVADDVGLDKAAWGQCMQDPAAIRKVAEDALTGGRAGVRGTPTMFIHGLDGDVWYQICGGAVVALALVDAHQNGVELPKPAQASCY